MAENIQITPELIVYKNDKPYDLSEFVQSIQVTKSTRNPVGAFNIVLNPTISLNGRVGLLTDRIYNEINSVLAVNDVIAGKIDSRSKKHSLLGLTSQHFESKVQFNNQTSRSIVINGGFALPKLLMRDLIVTAPQLASVPEIKNDPVLSKRAKFFAWTRLVNTPNYVTTSFDKQEIPDTPEKFVKWILSNAVATNIKIYKDKNVASLFPSPSSGIKDYLGNDLLNFKFLTGEYIYGDRLSTFSGPLMNYIYECLDREFYEVFFDTTSDSNGLPYNTMTIRTKPFSHKDVETPNFFENWTYWEDLAKQAVTVKTDDLIQTDIGKSDYELKNFFRVNYRKVLIAQALGQFGLNFPIVNVNSIKRHGLRPLEVDSTILVDQSKLIKEHNDRIAATNVGSIEWIADIIKGTKTTAKASSATGKEGLMSGLLGKRDKIKEWFAFPYYENGSLRMPHNEEVTIGRLINLPDYEYYFPLDGKVYKGIKIYPTDVTHTYSFGQLAETRATVTTGQPDGVVKKWFDHPDNKFTGTPLEDKLDKVVITTEADKKIFDGTVQLNKDMLVITELPNE